MYAETGIFFPYLQNFSADIQQLEDYCKSQKFDSPMNNSVPRSGISKYVLAEEGGLFKAPEPIIEDPIMAVDPMIAMISCNDDLISLQGPTMADIESIQSDRQLLEETFYACGKDLLAQAVIEEESPFSEGLDEKIPLGEIYDNNRIQEENKVVLDALIQKSVSSGCLSSTEWVNGGAVLKPNFLDFSAMDFESVYGMRRAFSEGDIKTIGTGGNVGNSPLDRIIGNCTSEDRREKLSRYRNKKTKRNFGRKIKYACRKALADSQRRVRGRFAKTEESDVSKRQ